jgi:hypothetical protein
MPGSDPSRLVPPVKAFVGWKGSGKEEPLFFRDPGRLVRPVKEFTS